MKFVDQKDAFYLKYLALFLVTSAVTVLLLTILKVTAKTYQLVTDQIALLGILLVACAGCKKYFLMEFRKIDLKAAAISLLLGVSISLATSWLQHELNKLGFLIVPGASQINPGNPGAAKADFYAILVSVIFLGPLMEELLFRFIGLGLVNQTILSNLANGRLKVLLLMTWSVLISILFALLHRPGLPAFPFYFGSSIIYCLLFNKFGLIASLLAHSATNAGSTLLFLWP